MTKILLLEFNEICPPLLERWMAAGRLANFARFHAGSQVFTTVADELDPVNLEPWIQWYSIHTGLPFREHRVFRLTDGPKSAHGDIWRHLQSHGRTVMNCSSMNARAITGERAFFLPDPWCATQPAHPPELQTYNEFVSRMVQEYSREHGVLSFRETASFVRFLATHGLSPATVLAILSQLADERIARSDVKWKRAALLDRLQLGVFQHYYRRLRPDFATFFINSTAHLQHTYWRHMDPEPFSIKPSTDERAAYGDAILFGYQAMDTLLREFERLVDDDTVTILCSALSQQPFLRREGDGGQHFYRLRDVAALLRRLAIAPQSVEPVMTHQYVLRFGSPAEVEAAVAALRAVRLADQEVFAAVPSERLSLYIGCQLYERVAADAAVTGLRYEYAPVRFFDLFYAIDAIKSGCHHPDGVLWIRTGRHAVHRERVSILDIAPTICELIGVPGDINARGGGTSLVPAFSGGFAERLAS